MIVDLIPGPAYSWESQACQYDETGRPGMRLEQHLVEVWSGKEVFFPVSLAGPDITVIDCLLHRDESGTLVGILNHYDGRHPMEKADAINLWVRPDMQRRGIATALVTEAVEQWPGIRPDGQRYTKEGVLLLRSLLERG